MQDKFPQDLCGSLPNTRLAALPHTRPCDLRLLNVLEPSASHNRIGGAVPQVVGSDLARHDALRPLDVLQGVNGVAMLLFAAQHRASQSPGAADAVVHGIPLNGVLVDGRQAHAGAAVHLHHHHAGEVLEGAHLVFVGTEDGHDVLSVIGLWERATERRSRAPCCGGRSGHPVLPCRPLDAAKRKWVQEPFGRQGLAVKIRLVGH